MSHLFATPGMTTMTVLLIAIQLVSLLVMALFTWEFYRIARKRERMLRDLEQSSERRHYWYPLAWVYIGVTVAIAAGTTYLFIFQPHLL